MAPVDNERGGDGSVSSVPPAAVVRLAASMPEPPEAGTRRARRRAVVSIVIGMLLWEFVGRFVVTSPILFAPLSKVLVAGWSLFLSGDLVRHIAVSALEFAIGFGLATVLGVALGFAMATNRAVQDLLDPWVSFFYSSPLVALIPFFILVFGVGIASKIAIIFLVSIFPILLNAFAGIRAADENSLRWELPSIARDGRFFRRYWCPPRCPTSLSACDWASAAH